MNTLNIDKLRADNENDLVYIFHACNKKKEYFGIHNFLTNWWYKDIIYCIQMEYKFLIPYDLWKKYKGIGYRQTDFYNFISDILLREFNIKGLTIELF